MDRKAAFETIRDLKTNLNNMRVFFYSTGTAARELTGPVAEYFFYHFSRIEYEVKVLEQNLNFYYTQLPAVNNTQRVSNITFEQFIEPDISSELPESRRTAQIQVPAKEVAAPPAKMVKEPKIEPFRVDRAKADEFLRAVNSLSGENSSAGWKSKLAKKGFSVIAVSTNNGAIWFEVESMSGDAMCAHRSGNGVFVVPSPLDRTLRSSQISSWYDIKGRGREYRLKEMAVGKLTPGGGNILPEIKGVIVFED